MARGSKSAYTGKQRRKARHIEQSARSRGRSSGTAKRIAYATINKYEGGGKKSGSGRGKKRRKGGRARARSR
jgi:hypothetical protein